MSKRGPHFKAIEDGLRHNGMTRKRLRELLDESPQNFQHFLDRRIPDERVLDVAKHLQCDPWELRDGRFVPWVGVRHAEAVGAAMKDYVDGREPLTDDGHRIGLAFQGLPDSIQKHINAIINDVVGMKSPILKRLYSNASRRDQERNSRELEEAQRLARGGKPKKTTP